MRVGIGWQHARAAGAPTLTGSSTFWGTTQVNWADIQINFTFVHGTFPVATIEVWMSLNGLGYSLLATIASTATNYYHAQACDLNGGDFNFKVRYKNGATLGPFSNVLNVYVPAQ